MIIQMLSDYLLRVDRMVHNPSQYGGSLDV